MVFIAGIIRCPIRFNDNHINVRTYILSFALLCSGLAAFWYCGSLFVADEHPEYFNPVLRYFDSTETTTADASMAALDAAFYAFPHPGTTDKVNRYWRKWSLYHYEREDYITAAAYADSIIELVKDRVEEQKFAVLYVQTLYAKGNSFYKLKNYEETLRHYLLGNVIVSNNIADRCRLTEYYGNMGFLMFAQQKYMLALQYFLKDYNEQVLCSEKTYDRFLVLQRTLTNIGLCYYSAGMYDSAYTYYNKSLFFIDQNWKAYGAGQNPAFLQRAYAVLYSDIAEILTRRSEYAAAEILYERSAEVMRLTDNVFAQRIVANKAAMYVRSNQLEKAAKAWEELDSTLARKPDNNIRLVYYKGKADFFAALQEDKLYVQYMQQYFSLKDSMSEAIKAFSDRDIVKEYELNDKKAINENLEKDNTLKNIYILVGIITMVMCLAILLLVWNHLKNSGRHIQESKKLNKVIHNKNIALQNAFNALEQSHKENTRIVRIVAHDLRNPIGSINNIVYSLLKKDQRQSVREILELIRADCKSSISLIKGLLDNTEKGPGFAKESFNMARLLEHCVSLQQAKADEKQQQLKLFAADIITIEANRQKLWRVISSMVSNAIQLSPVYSVIEITLRHKAGKVLLSVHDSGTGIPDELHDNIFNMQPSAVKAAAFAEELYGLGLFISYRIVAEHNGKMWFENVAGKGSVFHVELPGA